MIGHPVQSCPRTSAELAQRVWSEHLAAETVEALLLFFRRAWVRIDTGAHRFHDHELALEWQALLFGGAHFPGDFHGSGLRYASPTGACARVKLRRVEAEMPSYEGAVHDGDPWVLHVAAGHGNGCRAFA